VCVVALVSACGDARETKRTDGEAAKNTVGGGPVGGTLVVLADREPDQLNPITYNSLPAYHAVHLMFRQLARRDTTLSGYAPDLASAWRLEDDSTLVIEVRRDVRWHDGVPVTAEDVVFTIERQRDAAAASPRQGDVEAVRSATARDSFTVQVRFTRAGLYTVNALLEVVPVPKHLLSSVSAAEMARAPFSRSPVGNGFYRFGSWTPGQNLTLTANAEKPDGRASIERIVMRFIPDISSALTELLTEQADLIPKLPADLRGRVESSQKAKVYRGPRVRPTWITWNTRRPPLNDVRVRRALLMAVNRDEIAKGLFGGIGEPALSPIPATLSEHTAGVRPLPYDTAGAKRLLSEAGWRDSNGDGVLDKGGRALRIEVDYVSSDQARQDVLIAMQSSLRRIGVDLAPRGYESSAWVQRLRDGSFTGSFWGWGWGPGVMGPNASMIFHSRSIPPNGPNFAASRNAQIDALLDELLLTTDSARAKAIWPQLEQAMIDDAAYAPIYLEPELFALHSRIKGVRIRGIEWTEDAPYWYVEPAARLPRDGER
jgi:peptide/nickel transport system substrate-binding protein